MLPSKAYLICSTLRSGGGLLAGLLWSTEVAVRPDEYFWRNDEAAWRSRWGMDTESGYVRRALVEGSTLGYWPKTIGFRKALR